MGFASARAAAAAPGLITYDNKVGIHAVRADGSGQRTLVDRWGARNATWSPDGRRFVYEQRNRTSDVTRKTKLVLARADGRRRKVLGRGFAPTWLPGGKEVAFRTLVIEDGAIQDHTRVKAVNIRTGKVRLLSQAGSTALTPDGGSMVFLRSIGDDTSCCDYQLVIASLEISEPEATIPVEIYWGEPVKWTPDGRVMYSCMEGRSGKSDLCLIDPETRRDRRLGVRRGLMEIDAAWSPSGRRLAISALDGLYVANAKVAASSG